MFEVNVKNVTEWRREGEEGGGPAQVFLLDALVLNFQHKLPLLSINYGYNKPLDAILFST